MLCVGLVVNVNYIFGNKDYKYKSKLAILGHWKNS
jgi:hypothetical protein